MVISMRWSNLLLTLLWMVRTTCGNILEVMAFHALCNEDKGLTYMRSDPFDCNRYLLCMGGISMSGRCPPGLVMDDQTNRCAQPKLRDFQRCGRSVIASLEAQCINNRQAKFLSPFSCSEYFDCALGGARGVPRGPGFQNPSPIQLMECPYPSLYNIYTRSCQPFDKVQCQARPVPKAPCDYMQYQQLCDSPSCQPCSKRHPSCVGLSNGAHPLAGYSTLYILCYSDRTFDIRKCNAGLTFSLTTKNCVKTP